jgi:hypothetical protein
MDFSLTIFYFSLRDRSISLRDNSTSPHAANFSFQYFVFHHATSVFCFLDRAHPWPEGELHRTPAGKVFGQHLKILQSAGNELK